MIMGGLFLLYRGLIDFRVPLLICLAAIVMLWVLPIPVAVSESAHHWRTLLGCTSRPSAGRWRLRS